MRAADVNRGRRQFLRFLAGSPLLTGYAAEPPLSGPKSALNVTDLEEAARAALPPAHFGYMATGVDDDFTLKANRDGFRKIQLRPRRLTDVSHLDTRVELFGQTYESPIFICPTGNQKAFHPEGELAVARAAQFVSSLWCFPALQTRQSKRWSRPPDVPYGSNSMPPAVGR